MRRKVLSLLQKFPIIMWIPCVLCACSSSPSHSTLSSLPEWVLNTPVGCGMGSLQHSGSIALAKTGSAARGRDALARQIQTKVHSIIKSYRSEGGNDTADLSEELMIDISQQSSRALLQGTRIRETYLADTNPSTLYTLVCYEPSRLPSFVKKLDIIPKKHRKAIKQRAEAAFAELESLMQKYD